MSFVSHNVSVWGICLGWVSQLSVVSVWHLIMHPVIKENLQILYCMSYRILYISSLCFFQYGSWTKFYLVLSNKIELTVDKNSPCPNHGFLRPEILNTVKSSQGFLESITHSRKSSPEKQILCTKGK